jgi:hypothetical protein
MPNDPPLQKRGGFNRGEQSANLTRIQHLGQPAIKAGPGDTIVFRNSPAKSGSGQDAVRAQAMNLLVSGWVFNRTGNSIDYDWILIDPYGNEFPYFEADWGDTSHPLADGHNNPIVSYGALSFDILSVNVWPLGMLPPGWTLVFRLTSGSPSAGKGIIIWPWAHDMSRNLQALIVPLTNTEIELGPDPGRAWQLCGNKVLQSIWIAPMYFNFDDISRTIEKGSEIYHLAGEDIPVNATRPDIVLDPRTTFNTGLASGFLTEYGETDKKPKGLVLAYPDKIKVKTKEAQHKAPLYMIVPFAEFDLPADMQE